ncbi:acylneuraminate cytidylyltransferase family protein [Vibrio sp. S4M6]|uniref:acylneuraminate cytidylyltransferase family protein n=1 Tax=Vibrio sinus TaxID=2946865 RepID=UPI002029F6B6|nr:acylneuraminate cytidylyltransferase family protein [Vibrio sinus]MCL9781557.1 acylneuraminate cytidylyltransferase family protein [Vibrio sinus]
MRLAIVPARGGSKRIPQKNIVTFCGRPMIVYALEALKQSRLFDKIHVSTDCEEIRNVVIEEGFSVDFMRDPKLADDYTGLIPVMRWVLDEYKKLGEEYTQVCCMMPTAPLCRSQDLLDAYEIFEQAKGHYPLIVYAKYPVPIEWAFRRQNDGLMSADSPDLLSTRSQDLEDAYYECGPFTLWTSKHLNQREPQSGKVLPYIMPNERAVDIDTPDDLAYAERLYRLMYQ